ncbi:hypothetical protein KR067_003391, partial [Drosophila pandora]
YSQTAKVFVGSLPPGCKPEELRRLFANYGSVVECDVMNRCAFVHLANVDMADAAISALNGTNFKGQNIVVEAGRPKYGNGPRNGGGGRPSEGPAGSPNKRSNDSGNNFKRSNYREEGSSRFSGGNNFNKPNEFGPMRKEANYRQERSAPYSKGPSQQSQSKDGFRNNKFASGGNATKFGEGNRFSNNRFQQQRDQNGSRGFSNTSKGPPTGRRPNFKNSPTSAYGGGGSQSDYSTGSNGGGSNGGSRGPDNNVRQDRRGFALPVEHQHQGFNRFANGPINSGNRGDAGANGPHGGRGFFNGGAGMNGRRGSNGPPGNEYNNQEGGRGSSNRGGVGAGGGGKGHLNGLQAYHTEFPPLGSGGGSNGPTQRNRFNGPRPGPNMGGNRRF